MFEYMYNMSFQFLWQILNCQRSRTNIVQVKVKLSKAMQTFPCHATLEGHGKAFQGHESTLQGQVRWKNGFESSV